jgi:hypothetical protein
METVADLFAKALSTLSVQIPMIGTLVGVVSRSTSTFPTSIVSKLETSLIDCLQKGDIPSIKLILRSLAVLGSAGCLDSESLVHLFDMILTSIISKSTTIKASDLSEKSSAMLYLLSSSVPWAMTALLSSIKGKSFLEKLLKALYSFTESYVSPYDVSGAKKNLFYAYYEVPQADVVDEGDEEAAHHHVLSVGPENACCWDNLSESVSIALSFINQGLDQSAVSYPTCMSAYWAEIPEESQASRSTSLITLSRGLFNELDAIIPVLKPAAYKGHWLTPRFYIYEASSISSTEDVGCFRLTKLEKHMLAIYYIDILHFFDPSMNLDGTMKGSLDIMCHHLLALGRVVTRNYVAGGSGKQSS